MDSESFLKKVTLKVYGMVADEGGREHTACAGEWVGSSGWSLECFDYGLSCCLNLDGQR